MNVKFVTDRFQTHSAKFSPDCPDTLYCGVADMDIAAPEPIKAALQAVLDHGVYGYTDLPKNYKELVSTWMNENYACKTAPEWILFSPRINMGLNMAVDTFTAPGDKIIVNTPSYPALTNAVTKWDRVLTESPLINKDGTYKIDFEQLEAVTDENTKAFILCNPHNPTGRVWSDTELKQLIRFCKKHDLLLLSDDIHGDFVWPGHKYTPLLNLYDDPEQERIILFNSVTKTFNLPGVILSNAIVPNPAVREKYEKAIDRWGLHNPNIFAAAVLQPAYTACSRWKEEMKEIVCHNIKATVDFIHTQLPELDVVMPEGTYLLWIGYTRTGCSEEEMELLLKQAHIAPLMGSHFGAVGRGYFRLNAGTSMEQLNNILERLTACRAR